MLPRSQLRTLALSVVLGLLVLSGCSSTSENFEEPAAAPEATGDAQVRKIWSRRVARGQEGQFLFLEPALVEDTVYAATADGHVTAYNARNGRRDWWVDMSEPLLAGIGADDAHLYVTTRSGDLIALDRETGEEAWRASMASEVLSPPQSNGNLVVAQTINSTLVTFDASTGQRRWQYDTNQPVLTYRGTATPYIDDARVITGFDNGRVVALDVRTGRVDWEYVISTPSGRTELERLVDVDGTPVVQNGMVYVTGYRGRVAALDLRSGGEQWSRPVSSLRAPGVTRGEVFVATADGQLIAYDLMARAERWRTSDFQWRRMTAPLAMGDYLLVGDFEGYLYAVRQDDGHVVGRTMVDEQGLRSDIIEYGDRILVFGNGGQLASYRIVERP